jgi:transcription elongation GreA/GreB family factor
MPEVSPPSTTASSAGTGPVTPGSTVRVRDGEEEHEHTIVARVTAAAPLHCASVASPVGRALLGRRAGDQVQVHTPGGVRLLTIVDVTYAAQAASPGSAPRCEG